MGSTLKRSFAKIFTVSYRNKTPFSVLRRTEKGVLLGYCLGVRRNHVQGIGCGPGSLCQ